mmetsp:Transcript_2856/g.5495  ORF Transcript_2856/g.5495 Transcript_2856/m.5495 type:complete len:568 (-) Transcript_2856:221-1924(-)
MDMGMEVDGAMSADEVERLRATEQGHETSSKAGSESNRSEAGLGSNAGSGSDEEEVVLDEAATEAAAKAAALAEEEAAAAKAEEYKEEGNTKYKAKDYYGALDCYNLAIKTNPGNGAYYNNRAAAQLMLGQTMRCVESCEQCLKLDPGNLKALIRLGKAQAKLGKADEALATFKAALDKDPTNSTAFTEKREAELLKQRMTRARETLAEGDFKHALALAQAALRQAPDSREMSLIRTRGLIAAGDYDQAYSLTTKLMRDEQNDAQLLLYRAKCFYFQENFSNAIKHLQQALHLDPDYKEAQLEIRKIRKLERLKESGNTNFKARKFEDAFNDYSECLKVDEENSLYCAKLYCNRAASLQKMDRMEEALKDCDAAIKLNPDYGKAYMRRAAVLRSIGGLENIERAIHNYSEAERINGRSNELAKEVRDTKIELKKAKRKDYYAILELPLKERSTEHEIKKAYKKSALKWHPDRHASNGEEQRAKAEATFKDVREAYDVLSDPSKRQKYDAGQTLEEIDQGMPMGGGGNPNEIFEMFFGGGMGGMGGMGGGHHHGGGFRRGGGHEFHFG